ncbi:MAG: glycosyltransferase family 39 protein [Dehalococcoidia bacterium]|nr:glycosyltransferase family 39 protein [Dehalococcoidia bacterium]
MILLAYLALGGAYALNTPLWQSPDEPAHFNYVRDLALGKGFPVLQMGDYNSEYMERITAAHFPPDMSIDPIRYESHQPPLYYSLAALVYSGVEDLPIAQQVLSLRLFSLLMGVVILATAYRAVGQVFPGQSSLALGVTALIAFIPQHLHITGSIDNDVLGELLLTGILLLLLVQMRLCRDGSIWGAAVPLGFLLGLALLAKDTAYIAVPLAPLGLALGEGLKERFSWLRLAYTTAASYLVALAVSGWWFVRNLLTYGNLDLFGLLRHNQVVVGQPRVGVFDWAAAGRFLTVGFQSFWAQFGWMGVPSDSRTYAFVGLLSALMIVGLAVFLVAQVRRPTLTRYQVSALALLAASFLMVLAGVTTYNLEFIQPQGRYLFPALLSIGVFGLLGLRQLMGRRPALPTAIISLCLFALAVYNLWRVLIPGFRY